MKRTAASVSSFALVVSLLAFAQVSAPVQAAGQPRFFHACGAVTKGFARCDAIALTNGHPGPNARHQRSRPSPNVSSGRSVTSSCGAGPNSGYTACQLQDAYRLTSAAGSNGAGETETIVDAYLDSKAFSDLSTYRSAMGLPALTNCATSNTTSHCFWQVGQTGSTTSLPSKSNSGWTAEQSLDVDMASAICPNCNIVLVETNSNSFSNLQAGVSAAANFGHNVVSISNSYGGSEASSDTSNDSSYNHPGVAVTVSTGDSGYGVQWPASSPYVTAVGGTTLSLSGSTWNESAWNGAGSGCSAYEGQPTWQTSVANITSLCSKRAVADVSAEADPNTGVAVYNSTSYQYVRGGWQIWGGTSVASPIIGGVYALANNTGSINYGSYSYSHTSSIFDVTSGSNGSCGNDLCNAATGWDGPTGNGTPDGTGAF